MSQNSKKSTYTLLASIVAGLLIAKASWVALEFTKLPKKGEDIESSNGLKPLYYHYSLASKKDLPKVIKTKTKTVKRNVVKKPKPEKFNKFILTGIYDGVDKKIVALEYLGKNYVLTVGEGVEGYIVTKVYPTYAIFTKNKKEYKLDLYKEGTKSSNTRVNSVASISSQVKPAIKNNKIEKEGDTTYIPKNLFNKYKTNINAIRQNIGVVPYMDNGKLNGFKIRYVKKGSDFDKLGVKRGDIITAINGEPLDNFRVPLEFFNNLDSITAATLTVKRGNEIKELEYEVR